MRLDACIDSNHSTYAHPRGMGKWMVDGRGLAVCQIPNLSAALIPPYNAAKSTMNLAANDLWDKCGVEPGNE